MKFQKKTVKRLVPWATRQYNFSSSSPLRPWETPLRTRFILNVWLEEEEEEGEGGGGRKTLF